MTVKIPCKGQGLGSSYYRSCFLPEFEVFAVFWFHEVEHSISKGVPLLHNNGLEKRCSGYQTFMPAIPPGEISASRYCRTLMNALLSG